nr:ribonuclease H-like domain-containing protein [Tanacetum cinerariifolium]
MIKVLPPKTTKEVVVRERERKARTTSLMALLEDHLAKFHKTADAKEMWEAIKSRFGGNDDSRRRDVGYNGNKARDNGRSPAYQDDLKALVTIDGEDIDWSGHTSVDDSDSKTIEYASCESDSSVETTTSMPAPVDNAPKIVYEPKAWTDAPIIEEYESDSDDDLVSNVQENIEKPSFAFTNSVKHVKSPRDDPHKALKDKGIVDSGCSEHMTGNKAHLANYQEFKGGFIAFGGSNGKITSKGKIKAGRLDFEDVYYVEELKHYNLFFVSQICDKKNKVLFTNTDCLVLSPDFKFPNENQVLLKIPRRHNMYSFNLKNIDPSGDLYCLFVKASIDESNKWHRRLGHVNFKNLNKLVKGNLVRGLPSKIFKNDHTCVACQKRKQHKASCPQEANNSAGTQANDDQGTTSEEIDLHDEHFVLPIGSAYSTNIKSLEDKIQKTTYCKTCEKPVSPVEQIFQEELEKLKKQEKEANDAVGKDATHETYNINTNITNLLNVVSLPVSAVGPLRALNDDEPSYLDDPSMPHFEDIYASPSVGIFTDSSFDNEGVVWILVDLPFGKKAIGTKWVYRNKKDERGVVVRNKACLVAQGHRQEEGIDYYEFFALVARIKALRIFSSFASYMGFIVYQIDVKSAFLYGTIDEEVKQKEDGIFIRQDKYVAEILKKFDFLSVKTASILINTQKPLVKDEEAADVDVHLYRSMISSLMYLTASRPDIMFAVCACSRFQVTPKTSHLQAVKRIFRYLKGQPKLGLWYPKVSSFDLEAYPDSDYVGANLDRKSTTGGCQFLGRRLILWQYKKQTIVATSTTEAEYVADVHCSTLLKRRLLEVTTAKHSKELASPKQTALGKDESNLLILDSLLKTIWSSMHHVIAMKQWLFQSKRLLGSSPIDGKRVNIKESSIHRTLKLDDEEGDMSQHQDIYDNPSLTKKVFTNMERVGTGFSRVVTPLFENMLVPAAEEVGQAQDDDWLKLQELMDLCIRLSNKVLDLESEVIDIKFSFTDKIEKLKDMVHKLEEENKILKGTSFKSAKVDTVAPIEDKEESFKQGSMIADMDEDVEVNLEENQAKAYNLDLQHSEKVLSMQDIDEEEHAKVEEVLKVVTAAKLMTKVVTTAQPTTTAAQVSKASAQRRRRGVVIQDPEETASSVILHTEDEVFERQLEAELNASINWNDIIDQVKKSEMQNNEVMREDLETLCKLVKERFETTEPKNFSDDFLLNIFKIMFEKPNVEANVWKDQKGIY